MLHKRLRGKSLFARSELHEQSSGARRWRWRRAVTSCSCDCAHIDCSHAQRALDCCNQTRAQQSQAAKSVYQIEDAMARLTSPDCSGQPSRASGSVRALKQCAMEPSKALLVPNCECRDGATLTSLRGSEISDFSAKKSKRSQESSAEMLDRRREQVELAPHQCGSSMTISQDSRQEAFAARTMPLMQRGNNAGRANFEQERRRAGGPLVLVISFLSCYLISLLASEPAHAQQVASFPGVSRDLASFPGVSRDLASFCSARPSLSIDLAAMIVHVKKATSFNYKLYLFSADNYVFQTGQIVPRDDFRIHSFPVKLKHFNEFLPADVATFQQTNAGSLAPVASATFNAKAFFTQVPIDPDRSSGRVAPGKRQRRLQRDQKRARHLDAQGDIFTGDESPASTAPFGHHDVALRPEAQLNSNVHFDRDDQVAALDGPARRVLERRELGAATPTTTDERAQLAGNFEQQLIMPVGAFSSFHVNTTYLVRKDFDQRAPELVRLQVDPAKFQVSQVHLLGGGGGWPTWRANSTSTPSTTANATQLDDYAFLSHKLLTDPNTRITSVNQIYEDWITRNFYTIVYIQRRLEAPETRAGGGGGGAHSTSDIDESSVIAGEQPSSGSEEDDQQATSMIVNDRLIFRGSSLVLLGADQLDYAVKASAFITEKNGLHYYFEFLTRGKFYLGAIDWTQRPFTIIDAQRFPLRQTKTKFDNEELLLCPPSICYSERPVDELVGYGRLAPLPPASGLSPEAARPPGGEQAHSLMGAERAAANQLEVRLHLRDWTWTLARGAAGGHVLARATTTDKRQQATSNNSTELSQAAAATAITTTNGRRFAWHYERARRNDIKVTPDTYGFVLTGHEIDASYRVHNELYLISANHLITINYTLANETVTSAHPLADEFRGLSSTLLDPITGAYYDRRANQLYFFKGDRYVGYDYATKRPLEDFLLPPAIDALAAGVGAMLQQQAAGGGPSEPGRFLSQSSAPAAAAAARQPLVSSLPVVNILGRQHQVDAIYHDLLDDSVHVFAGAKFYTFQASEFKDGAFRAARQPALRCANEHFFEGCRFDEAFPNPCRASEEASANLGDHSDGDGRDNDGVELDEVDRRPPASKQRLAKLTQNELDNFNEEQQAKLRSIAARGGGLLDALLENTLVGHGGSGAKPAPISTGEPSMQERIVIYLLIAMVLVTILVTVTMIFVILSWSRRGQPGADEAGPAEAKRPVDDDDDGQTGRARALAERIAYPPAIGHYLANQYQQQQQLRQQLPNPYHHHHQAAARYQQVSPAFMGGEPSDYPHHNQYQQQANFVNSQALGGASRAFSSSRFGRDTTIVDSSAL